MKKFFVLYSLRQKLTPTLYKTKVTVTKHASSIKGLKFEQFDTQQQATSFIDQIILHTKQSESSFLTEKQIKEIVTRINPNSSQTQPNSQKLSISQKKKIQQQQKRPHPKKQWTILPNNHAMRIERSQQSHDSQYSSLQPQQTKNQMQLMTKPPLQQSAQTFVISQDYTTDGNTEESVFGKLSKKSLKKQQYWVIYNRTDYSHVEFGKKLAEMGKILYQLEEQHSAQWVKENITTKQFKIKKDALVFLTELNQQKKSYINKLKDQLILENIVVAEKEVKQLEVDELENGQSKVEEKRQSEFVVSSVESRQEENAVSQQQINAEHKVEEKRQSELSISNAQSRQQEYAVSQEQINVEEEKVEEKSLSQPMSLNVESFSQNINIQEQNVESQQVEKTIVSQSQTIDKVKVQAQQVPTIEPVLEVQKQINKEEPLPEQPIKIQKVHQKPSKYIHPFNKKFIREYIRSRRAEKDQASSIPKSQPHFQDESYEIYPSLRMNQNPGISFGQYQVKSQGKVIQKHQIPLGQTKRQQGNLLTLAFSLSSLNTLPQNKNIKIHLNPEMQKALNYSHKFDHKVIETKQFVSEMEQKFRGRVEYVV